MITKLLTSSTGEGLAKRWESLITGVIPAVVALSTIFGWGVTELSLNELNGRIILIISSLVAIWKAVSHIEGWVRMYIFKKDKLGKYAEVGL